MKYKIGDILLVSCNDDTVRTFIKITQTHIGAKSEKYKGYEAYVLYDFYNFNGKITEIESYPKKPKYFFDHQEILGKWSEKELEVFLLLEE